MTTPASTGEPLLAHMVYFTLTDNSPAAIERQVAACHKYLSGHPGTVHFSVGTVCQELNRPVNVRDFDVALHVVFESKAAHDRYQEAERHLQFIAENKPNWKQVRVFDAVARG
jgi:hypothetical protein